MFQKILISLLFLSWNLFFVSSYAEMQIEITHGLNTAYPIAVMPFVLLNKDISNFKYEIKENLTDIASVISDDLYNSGKFSILPIPNLEYQPIKVSDIIPAFWEKLGIHIIVLGSINLNYDDNYTISYQLIDTSNNPALVILENQYLVQKKWIRYTAHTISNEIFEKLTGIRGIFCTRLAYIQYICDDKHQRSYALCISDYDGFNPMIICRSSDPLMSPAWSADGEKIAYVTFSSGQSELVIQSLQTGLINQVINFPRHNGAPSFSPDGKKLAFVLSKTGSLNLYIMDLISGKIRQLTNNRYNNTEPSWFPDSNNLAYTSDQGGVPQIYKINVNTASTQRVSWLYMNNQSPNVSKDGTFILMVNRRAGKQNIAKLDLLTGTEEVLTNTFLDDTPSIAPNDTMIVYSTIKELTSVIELAAIDGSFKSCLKKEFNGNIRFPTWSTSLQR